MTTYVPRVDAVRVRLAAGREKALKAAEAGSPCVQCAYFVATGRLCGHPASVRQTFDPVEGHIVEEVHSPALRERADDGVCGPEALLFEARRYALARKMARHTLLILWIALMWLFTGMIFWALAWPLIIG